jgi:hypothetical protein
VRIPPGDVEHGVLAVTYVVPRIDGLDLATIPRMGRERCLLCGRFIFADDAVTRPPTLGVPVHRDCYVREAGLDEPPHRTDDQEPERGSSRG